MIRVGRAVWVALRFEQLCLEIVDRVDARPLAIVEHHRIVASDHPSIEPGLAVATAHALVADLMTLTRQPEREAQALLQLAYWAYGITPVVVIADENTLLLELGGCRRLYGNLKQCVRRLQITLEQRGHHVAIGVAHTPKAAWLIAMLRSPAPWKNACELDAQLLEDQLGAIPLVALPIDPKISVRLHHMGIETLGRALGFDWALLGKRLGIEFIRYLQQLTGHLPDPQRALALPPQFEQGLTFLDGVANRQTLLFPMKRLVQTFADYLIARQLHCRALEWRFSDAHRVCATMAIELSRPHHRWKPMLDLAQLKLDAVELPELVFSVTLFADQFVPISAGSVQLFEEDQVEDEGYALIDKLIGRLGVDAVQRLSTVDSLWPEAASQWVSFTQPVKQQCEPCGTRPSLLLPEPEPLRVHNGTLVWHTPLELLSDAERLESPPHLGNVQHRDYFIAREADGNVYWIFRDLDNDRWFLHGFFA